MAAVSYALVLELNAVLGAAGATVLAAGAHPDDVEIGAGGTLLRLRRTHPDLRLVWLVMCAEGERRDEAVEAAHAFGADEVVVESFPDRFLPSSWADAKRRLAEVADEVGRVDLVIGPWRGDRHQDHRTLAELLWGCFRTQPIWGYELLKHEDDMAAPNLLVALDDDVAAAKLDLLGSCFPSQHGRRWWSRATFEAVLRVRGVHAGAAFAEGFHVEKAVW